MSGVRAIGGYEGTLDDGSDMDSGALVEMKIPRELISVKDGALLVDYRLTKVHGKTDAPSNVYKPSEWLTINNL